MNSIEAKKYYNIYLADVLNLSATNRLQKLWRSLCRYVPFQSRKSSRPVFPNVSAQELLLASKNNHVSSYSCSCKYTVSRF